MYVSLIGEKNIMRDEVTQEQIWMYISKCAFIFLSIPFSKYYFGVIIMMTKKFNLVVWTCDSFDIKEQWHTSDISNQSVIYQKLFKVKLKTGASGWLGWLSIQLLISAQVVISPFVGLSPASGSTLTGHSLLKILSLPSLSPSPVLYAQFFSLPHSLSK